MAVFPEGMNKLDANDVRGSLAVMEDYIRYMSERMEFTMQRMTKTAVAASDANEAKVQELTNLVNDLQNQLNALTERVAELEST